MYLSVCVFLLTDVCNWTNSYENILQSGGDPCMFTSCDPFDVTHSPLLN